MKQPNTRIWGRLVAAVLGGAALLWLVNRALDLLAVKDDLAVAGGIGLVLVTVVGAAYLVAFVVNTFQTPNETR